MEIASIKLNFNVSQGQGLSECEIISKRKLFSITLRFTPTTDSYARMAVDLFLL